MNDIWFSYDKIKFKREQILWVLQRENYELLKEGDWPPKPLDSGYKESTIITKRIATEGSFAKPGRILGEIEARLEMCGVDGLMLKLKCWKEEPESLAKYFGITPEAVLRRAESALRFITSEERPKSSYRRWNYMR